MSVKTSKYLREGKCLLIATLAALKESNWLPAPDGNFSLILRNYWPEKAIVDGTWVPPGVVKVN